MATFRTDEILVVVWWFSYFWYSFDLLKFIKFGGSRNFLEDSKGEQRYTVMSLLEAPGAKTLPRALLFRAIFAS